MYYPGICLEEPRNTCKTSDRKADSRNDIWSWNYQKLKKKKESVATLTAAFCN